MKVVPALLRRARNTGNAELTLMKPGVEDQRSVQDVDQNEGIVIAT